MAGNSTHEYPPDSGRGRAGSDPYHALPHEGGATVVDTASYADTDLIGLQAHLPGMHSAGDDASGIYPSPSDYSFPEESDSFMTLFPSDDCHGNSQYFPSSSNSPSFRDSQHATFQAPGVSSHHSSSLEVQAQPQDQAPWTHIDVFGREISPSTDDTPTNLLGNPQHLATSVHRPLHSTASGETSVRDSAYCTDPNRSQHGFESVTGLSGEQMDQCGQNYPPVPLYDQQQMATYAPSTSSTTITQAPYNNNNPLSTLPVATQQANQPAASNSNLYCHECNHQAKTRSDFKKHNARHERQHTCPMQGCSRRAKGFATSNDLDRHLKSVHQVNRRRDSKYFKCCSEGCPRGSKLWPRQDNFRQHLIKMHPDEDEKQLLKLSEEWFEQTRKQEQTTPYDEAQLPTDLDDMNIDTADMSVARQFEVYGPDNSSFQMGDTGQPDFDFNTAPVNLNFTPSPAPRPATQRQPRRRVSTSATGARAQGRFRPPVLDTRSVAAPAVAMQRTRSSQAIHPQYPAEQFSINPNFFVGNVTIPDLPWWSQPPFANVTPEYPVNYTFANNQICKTRRPHTVADPCQDANRMADTSSPMEPQPSVLHELRGQQDDYLMNTTGGATIESVTPTSSQQNFQLKVTPPENEGTPDEAKLTRLVVDEIHKFVDQIQKSKSDKAESSLPVEDIVSHFKLSLRSVGSAESSSVSRFTGEADNESAISKTSPISKEGPHICPVCSKTTNRASELKKHIQRHEKPFGCTQDGCQKSFGSKSDWIRHEERCENNKHQQQDFWRCLECRDVLCRDVKQYVRHMSEVHSITALENTRYDPRWRRIARNYQGPFWCGFCNMVIPHHKQGRDAINVRFDHIAEHFTKDKMKIRNWIELSGHGKTKEARSQGAQAPLPPAAALVMDKDDDNTLAPESEGVGTQSCSPDPRVGLGDQVFFPSSQPSSMDIEDLNVLEHFSFNGQFQDLQQKLTGQMSTTTMTLQAPGHSKAMYAYPARATRRQRQHHQQCHKPMQERAQSVTCCQCEVSANVSLSKFCINCPHEFCPACEYKGAPKEDR